MGVAELGERFEEGDIVEARGDRGASGAERDAELDVGVGGEAQQREFGGFIFEGEAHPPTFEIRLPPKDNNDALQARFDLRIGIVWQRLQRVSDTLLDPRPERHEPRLRLLSADKSIVAELRDERRDLLRTVIRRRHIGEKRRRQKQYAG